MKRTHILLLSTILLFSGILTAQARPLLGLVIQDEKVNKSAAEISGKVDITYHPGDTILYHLVATNNGDQVLTDPVIVDPIPAGVTFIPKTVSGAGDAQFSIDGGNTYQIWPPKYSITDKQGKTVKREATPDMITHIKWVDLQNLEPEQFVKMDFQVIVTN